MHRRKFICGVAGAVTGAAAPLTLRTASAEQVAKVRRLGVLMGSSESDSGAFFVAFVEELARLGWRDGRNLRIELRWSGGDADRISTFARELVELRPDVLFCSSTKVTAALHRETSTVPIVFAIVSDPVGSGLVAGLPRPGGNITGFTNVEAATGGKWLGLLKEIAPGIKRAAFVFNPDTAPSGGKHFLASFEASAGSLGIESVAIPVGSDAEIETAVATLGAEQAGLVEYSSFLAVHVGTLISSTARYNVPAIYENPLFASKGGLIAYGASFSDMFRRAAGYVDRILRGEKPTDLPVQTPTKFEMVINLITAKALGLNVPPSLLATADEVIE
jgi:putative tryptophan/tyrosine transport system substrate-binding protein